MRKSFCKHCDGEVKGLAHHTYCDWCGAQTPPEEPEQYCPRIAVHVPMSQKHWAESSPGAQAAILLRASLLAEDGHVLEDLDICLGCMIRLLQEAKEKEDE